MHPWPDLPTHRAWLQGELVDLLGFGRRVVHPDGGAAMLDDHGEPRLDRPVELWVTARMIHVHTLGAMLGVPGCGTIADRLVDGLEDRLADPEHGGWFSAVDADGTPVGDGAKSCYDHAFVLLAATTYAAAGRPGADQLLARARSVFEERFWDEAAGMCLDGWDRGWYTPDDYRGMNANMHAVEAMLATGDRGEPVWHARAARVAERLVTVAADHDWRIPEHFDPDWVPLPEYNADRRDDPFKPYGATVGHGLEWARLLLCTEAALGGSAPVGLLDAAVALFDRAVGDGWSVDGAPGFVYTTDWDGRPVTRTRMHWVVAEAVSAAAALWRRTGEEEYAHSYATWWDYAATYLIDRDGGSWHHELDPANAPSDRTWSGKPDLYHAVQATLVPRLPLTPSTAVAVADGLLAP